MDDELCVRPKTAVLKFKVISVTRGMVTQESLGLLLWNLGDVLSKYTQIYHIRESDVVFLLTG